ncbi:hypothetical protein PAEPH01_1977 [Pancytospora epiphaga]|nr:hypothetical protein PAEPH01_1977 [Pancytospora epiphaga]
MSTAKKSKGGILLDLKDPKLYEKTVKAVLNNPRIRIPKTSLFKGDVEKWREYIISHKCRKYYKYLDPQPKEDLEGLSELERLYLLGPRRAKLELKNTGVPAEQVFTSIEMEIFYLSSKAYITGGPADELKLFRVLSKHYESIDRNVLRNVFTRFSNATVLRYLKNEIMNIKGAFKFLKFVAPKLRSDVIELWFNEGFSYDGTIFRQMNHLSITPTTKFNCTLFEQFLELRAFRKSVFNFWKNDEFLVEMGDYINRGDYAYYYSLSGIPYTPLTSLSSDYQDYEFFFNFSISAQGKLRNYQKKHGTNIVLTKLLEIELDCLLENSDMLDIAIIIDVIKGNNRAINMKIWERLKNNENIFRRIVRHFPEPCDTCLFGLLTGDFTVVRLEDAEKWIRVCYEDELLRYFKGETVDKLLKIANSWNQEFFLEIFYEKLKHENLEADNVKILNFIIDREFKDTLKASKVLDKLFNVCSEDIYFNLSRNLKFVYTVRHKDFIDAYLKEFGEIKSSILDRAHIHELGFGKEYFVDEANIIPSLFEVSFVSKKTFRYYFAEYFSILLDFVNKQADKARLEVMTDFKNNVFFSEPEGSGADRINFYLKLEDYDYDDLYFQLGFIFVLGLSNRYTIFICFNEIIGSLTNNSNITKMLVLRFLDPSLVCKENVLEFFNSLIPLLNSPNAKICEMARKCLQKITIETREVQNILPVLIQALGDKQYVNNFISTFKSILFNNYLCFNSLNLIMQVLFKYINDFPEEVLEIVGKLVNISKGEDLEHVGRLVFAKLLKYVIGNHYHTGNALWAARPYCVYSVFEDYRPLIEHFDVPRLCQYAIGLLKARGSSELNRTIIEYVLGVHNMEQAINSSNKTDNNIEQNNNNQQVPHLFIAAACELNEFSIYFNTFQPTLEKLFLSGEAQKRTAAFKAFSEVLGKDRTCFSDEVRESVTCFVVKCAIFEDYSVRLACLDIIEYLPLLFIMKNDQHSQVRKKAYDSWKRHVEHPNRTLRIIFRQILDLIQFAGSRVFRESLCAAVAEMAVKYQIYLEQYIRENGTETSLEEYSGKSLGASKEISGFEGIPEKINVENRLTQNEIKEFILMEALKINRLLDLAFIFIKDNNASSALFNLLYRHEQFRNKLVTSLSIADLMKHCKENSDLAMFLYKKTGSLELLPYINRSDILIILQELELKSDLSNHSLESDQSIRDIKAVLACVEPSTEIEELILKSSPIISYLYLYYLSDIGEWHDFGFLELIFQRAFDLYPFESKNNKSMDMDTLITPETLHYVKQCSFSNVTDKIRLLKMLLCEDDRVSFERVSELVLTRALNQEIIFDVLGYLLRNYLLDTRRDDSFRPIFMIYNDISYELGYFRSIIKKSILKYKGK